jgi:hypothetical protein
MCLLASSLSPGQSVVFMSSRSGGMFTFTNRGVSGPAPPNAPVPPLSGDYTNGGQFLCTALEPDVKSPTTLSYAGTRAPRCALSSLLMDPLFVCVWGHC